MTKKINKADFKKLSQINDALNVLTDLPLIGDEWATEVFISSLDWLGYDLDDWVDRLDKDPDPQELLLEAIAIHKEVYEGDRPYNAAETVVGYLLEQGLSSDDAHSFLCTAETLYDYNLTVVEDNS